MSFLRHLFILCCYLGLSVAVWRYGPAYLPGLEPAAAAVLAGVVFFVAAFLHEVYARLGQDTYLGEELLALRGMYRDLQEEVRWSQRQVKVLREALEDAAESGTGAGGKSIDEVVAEVKVLQSLVQRFAEARKPATTEARRDRPVETSVETRAKPAPPRPAAMQARDREETVAEDLTEDEILEAAHRALRDDRIEVFLQPVVTLPQRRRRFYECLSRLRTLEGNLILPERYIGLAKREGLVTAIDNLLLFRCVQLIKKIQKRPDRLDFFCNISTHTLEDGDFIADLAAFLKANGELAQLLVFEFNRADYDDWDLDVAQQLDRLARLGCRFSLDGIEDLNLDPAALKAHGIAFVKVDSLALLGKLRLEPALVRRFAAEGVTVVAQKVENEELLVELLDHGVKYAQGYLLGEPRLARLAA